MIFEKRRRSSNLTRRPDCWEFESEFSLIHFENFPSELFSASQNMTKPISVLWEKGGGVLQQAFSCYKYRELLQVKFFSTAKWLWQQFSSTRCTERFDTYQVFFAPIESIELIWNNLIGLLWMSQTQDLFSHLPCFSKGASPFLTSSWGLSQVDMWNISHGFVKKKKSIRCTRYCSTICFWGFYLYK